MSTNVEKLTYIMNGWPADIQTPKYAREWLVWLILKASLFGVFFSRNNIFLSQYFSFGLFFQSISVKRTGPVNAEFAQVKEMLSLL